MASPGNSFRGGARGGGGGGGVCLGGGGGGRVWGFEKGFPWSAGSWPSLRDTKFIGLDRIVQRGPQIVRV